MMKQLNDSSFIAVTTDFWCDRSSRSYLCMTGHWYSDNMIIKSKVLVFTPYFDRHTSKNISSTLEYQLKSLKIFDKTTTITCDGASNMKASFKSIDARIKRLQCLAHKLHLIVCNALGLWVKPDQGNNQETDGKSNISWIFLKISVRLKSERRNSCYRLWQRNTYFSFSARYSYTIGAFYLLISRLYIDILGVDNGEEGFEPDIRSLFLNDDEDTSEQADGDNDHSPSKGVS